MMENGRQAGCMKRLQGRMILDGETGSWLLAPRIGRIT